MGCLQIHALNASATRLGKIYSFSAMTATAADVQGYVDYR